MIIDTVDWLDVEPFDWSRRKCVSPVIGYRISGVLFGRAKILLPEPNLLRFLGFRNSVPSPKIN